MHLNAEGDTEKGFHFTSEIGMRDAKFTFLKKDVKEILLKIHAFLSISDKTLIINNTSLNAGGITAIIVQGELKKINEDFFYTAGLKIKRLDLSAINFMKDVNIGGIVNSDDLRVQGSYKKPFPELSGSLELRDALFQARDFAAGQINADIKFTAGGAAAIDFKMKDMKYGGYTIPWLHAKSGIAYHDNIITLKAPDIQSQDFTGSSNHATIKLPLKNTEHGVRLEIRDMHASYPEKEAGITNADLSMTLNKESNVLSGDFGFSARGIMVKEIRTGFIKGSGRVDEWNFSAGSLLGKAALQAEKITIPYKNNKRTLIKDGILKAEIQFGGKRSCFQRGCGCREIISEHIGYSQRLCAKKQIGRDEDNSTGNKSNKYSGNFLGYIP